MSRSLFSAATGLLAQQRKLDVVANNLANLNTTGYKAQRVTFSDLIYQTLASASGSGDDVQFSGTNPSQVGNGVKVAQISRRFEQGVLQSTGEIFDYALDGRGFFTVSSGSQDFYTRDGSFTLNANGYLTVPGTGMLVQRTGTFGEPSENQIGFQTTGEKAIRIPLGSAISGAATKTADFSGNLPTTAKSPKTEVLISTAPFLAGGVAATSATTLNALDSNTVDYVAGDSITITGTNASGAAITGSLAVTPATTLGDLVTYIGTLYTDATVALNPDGNISVTANSEGDASLGLTLADAALNTGATNFDAHEVEVATDGRDGDIVTANVEIFDERGQAHSLTAQFQKKSDNTWDVSFTMPDDNGVFVDYEIRGVEFNDDGTFRRVNGLGSGDSNIEIDFNSITNNQKIAISFEGMSHTPANFGTFFEQDGYPTGILKTVSVGANGIMEAIATNGVRVPIAQLALASFLNEQALTSEGNNLFAATLASGQAQIGTGLSGSRGQVVGGNIEQSNVDIAYEFTQLIIAQRGFSANARTITVTDNVLEELTNIVR